MPVASKNAQKRLFELLIGERIAERIERTVKIAEPIRDIINDGLDTRQTESHDHREDMPRGPAENERSKDDGDGAQSLASSVLVLAGAWSSRRRLAYHIAP